MALEEQLAKARAALAEAVDDLKQLSALVETEREAERAQQARAAQALERGDEQAARAALEAKRRRVKERERHERLLARQRTVVARRRVAAAGLREQVAAQAASAIDVVAAFRRSAWLRLAGRLPERALAKAGAALALHDEHQLRDQLRVMSSDARALERACVAQRAAIVGLEGALQDARAESKRWEQRAALALRAEDAAAAKAMLARHRSWEGRVRERADALQQARERLNAHERAASRLAEALAAAKRAAPIIAGSLRLNG